MPADRGNLFAGSSGLGISKHSEFDVSVYSWDDASLDACAFDVAAPQQPDGSIPRFPIEVFWPDVYRRQKKISGGTKRLISADPDPISHAADKPAGEREFSLEELGAEYLLRVRRWKADVQKNGNIATYSPEDDRAWAAAIFRKAPRRELRAVRNRLAPESWKKTGKKVGVIRHE